MRSRRSTAPTSTSPMPARSSSPWKPRPAPRSRTSCPRSDRLPGVLAATLVYHEVTTPEALGEPAVQLTRREAIKAKAAGLAALAANVTLPAAAQPVPGGIENLEIKWSKAPCRFCGTGCGVMVGRQGGPGGGDPRRHPGRGQPRPQLRQGLLPLQDHVRRRPPDHAAAAHAERRATPRTASSRRCPGTRRSTSWPSRPSACCARRDRRAVGMFGSGQWTIWEGYAATKLMRAGFRSNNLDPNARHCMASAATAFIRAFGMDEPMGCYDDFEAADAFVLWGSNMAEMHPILWTRLTDRRLSHPHVQGRGALDLRAPQLRSRRPLDRVQAGHGPRDPQLHRAPHHRDRAGQPGVRATGTPPSCRGTTDIGYGLRPEHPLEQKATGAADAATMAPSDFETYRAARRRLHARPRGRAERGRAGHARGSGRALRRSGAQGHVALDDGVQPARARRLGQPPRLQPPSADREDRRAGQQPVLAHRPAVRLRHRARGRHLRAPAAGRHGGDQPRAPAARRGDLEAARGPPAGRARLSRRAAGPHAQGRRAQLLLDSGQQQPAGAPNIANETYPGYRNPDELHRRLGRLPDGHRRWPRT